MTTYATVMTVAIPICDQARSKTLDVELATSADGLLVATPRRIRRAGTVSKNRHCCRPTQLKGLSP